MNLFMKPLFLVIFVTLGVLITSNRVNGDDLVIASADFKNKLKGFVSFYFEADDPGGNVMFVSRFEGGNGQEYLFRIHENYVDVNNDCETAGGNLDPDGKHN